jgi:hypothetical protein
MQDLQNLISELEFFIIVNGDGLFFRAKGFNGNGNSWVSDIKDAKIYQKLPQARSRVTYFANNYPGYKIPQIIKITGKLSEIINEKERIEKCIKAKAKRKLKVEERKLEWLKQSLLKQQAEIANKLKSLT